MMPLNSALRKCPSEYNLSKSQEKTTQLVYMDDNKRSANNK